MSKKELEEFKAILDKELKKVATSKKAARELLDALGLLTPTGKLKKRYRAQSNVSY